ncbi:MAG TPA: HD domain-containing phosphohydrolase [Chitinivibrionales bacterium]
MKKIEVSMLVPGSVADGNYYTEGGELLISKGVTISPKHLEAMTRRNIFDVYLKNFEEEEEIHQILSKEFNHLEDISLNEIAKTVLPDAAPVKRTTLKIPELKNIKPGEEGALQLLQTKKVLELDSRLKDGLAPDRPIGPALREKATQMSVTQRTEEYKTGIALSHAQALAQVRGILNDLADAKKTDEAAIRHVVNLFVKTYLTDKSILLNISNIKSAEGDYIYHHTLNVCLLAINIAAAAKYSEKQILEIGIGALLHDVGMLLVPDEIRFKKGRLEKDEWYEVQKHAVLGMHLLEKINRVPESALYVAYQTHERENGKGYPKQRSGRFIHAFAKIVQIADVYESLCSPRDYRPPYLPYRAMELLIKMSVKNLLSIDHVKAFLTYASLFPIGSIVELSNHCVARVIQANELHQTKPVVSVIMDAETVLLPKGKIYQLDLSQDSSIQIIRAVEPNNLPPLDIMHGF